MGEAFTLFNINLKLLFLKNNNGANIFSVRFNSHCTQKSDAVGGVVKIVFTVSAFVVYRIS